LENI